MQPFLWPKIKIKKIRVFKCSLLFDPQLHIFNGKSLLVGIQWLQSPKTPPLPPTLQADESKWFFILLSMGNKCLWSLAQLSLLKGRTSRWHLCQQASPVLWIRVDIVSAMSSISAFLTDLKRIQTPHTLFWDFWADKPFTTIWSGGRVQVWVQVWAPACHVEITPEGYPEGYWR